MIGIGRREVKGGLLRYYLVDIDCALYGNNYSNGTVLVLVRQQIGGIDELVVFQRFLESTV